MDNTTISAYLSTLIDCFITSPSTGQLLQYNGSKWVIYTPTTLINANEAGTLTQMYGIYGGGIGGAGIAQNTYYTVPSYIDNLASSIMLTNYNITTSQQNVVSFTSNMNNSDLVITSGKLNYFGICIYS